MTAAQVMELSSTMQRLFSPTLGRFHAELLDPTLNRVFGIGMRTPGAFPEVPEALRGTDFKFEYVSPVSRAAQGSEGAAVVDWLTVVANLAELRPEMLDNINFDEVTRFLAKSGSVPQILLNRTGDVEQLREARQQQQQQEQQRQAMMEGVETMGKAGPGLMALEGGAGGGEASAA
jgi:hypothetical protein